MGGTDLWDQLVSAYQTQVRTRRWQTRIIFHLLDGMVVNAHILYKQTYRLTRNDEYFSLKDFKAAIVKDWGSSQITRQATKKGKYQTTAASLAQNSQRMHTPMVQADQFASSTGARIDMRKRCTQCKNKTKFYCSDCDKFVCVDLSVDIEETCWSKLHADL